MISVPVPTPMSDAEAQGAVAEGLRLGYRLADKATNYRNEAGAGLGVARSGVRATLL